MDSLKTKVEHPLFRRCKSKSDGSVTIWQPKWRCVMFIERNTHTAEHQSTGSWSEFLFPKCRPMCGRVFSTKQLSKTSSSKCDDPCGEADTVNLVMEYMQHGSLRNIVKKLSTCHRHRGYAKPRLVLPEQHLAWIAFAVGVPRSAPQNVFPHKQALSSLHCLHKWKILHRDIKPENVLIGEAGEVKLTDFGVAAALTTSATNSCVGTQKYM
eukprot:Selendium_serpulae@DN7166_c0_g1_i1.p1